MIEKTHITKEDCPETASSSRRASALFFKILAAAGISIVLAQNIIVPMVRQAQAAEFVTLSAEVKAHDVKIAVVETALTDIKDRLARIESKQDRVLAMKLPNDPILR